MTGKIVIVDDSDFDVDVLKMGIKRYSDLDIPIIDFGDPDDLFSWLDNVRTGQEPYPALILLDVNLGIVTGHEVLCTLRADPVFGSKPPVIVISHSKSADDINKAMEAGAAGYQIKPATPDEFRDFCDFLISVIGGR